ncbi:MAG: penicillin-binding protein 2 [Candidatus Gracilibacteria bacterium]|nr:penicillin-binding protein 2 [Candidatus Gracilibacteria bacterium]
MISLFFVFFFVIIVQKLFSYTVLNYDFYHGLADKQQIGEVIVPVTRGTIYSATNEGTILGTSLNLYDIAIDPQIEGSKEKLESFLITLVYKQSCENQTRNSCYRNIVKFLRVLEIEDFQFEEEYIKKLITKQVNKKVYQEFVTSVFIDQELSQENIDTIASYGYAGIYPQFPYLYVNPEEITQIDTISKTLAPLLRIEEERLKKLLQKRKIQYIPILHKLSISVSEYVKTYLEDEKHALKKGLLQKSETIGGFIILNPSPHRYYPEKNVASQIIGFVDNQGNGNYGLEGYFNESLQGNKGKIVSRQDVRGRIINPIDLDKNDENNEGVNIHTTIDRTIQKKVENILEEGVKKYIANKGTIVVMEPKTGRVLAMANYPTYNLNNFSDVYEIEKVRYSKYPDPKIDLLGYPVFIEDSENGEKFYYDNKEIFLRKSTREELGDVLLVKYKYKNDYGPAVYQNDAISAQYEPGSIMKSLVFAMGIDTGEIEANELYNDINHLKVGEFRINNLDTKNCGGLHPFSNALDFSCNVGMVRIVQRLGTLITYKYFQKFGFDEPTGISLSGEETTKMTNWEAWTKSNLYTSSYGLGISVTALQMASAYSVLANGGLYYTPRLVDKVEYADGKVIEYKNELKRRVIKESTSNIMTKILVNGVRNGAAKRGHVEGYNLAGKTGTSQINYRGIYEKGQGTTMASFAGYGPTEDPKFVIIVKLERPRTSNYGGATSAHMFRELSEYLLEKYNIPRREK